MLADLFPLEIRTPHTSAWVRHVDAGHWGRRERKCRFSSRLIHKHDRRRNNRHRRWTHELIGERVGDQRRICPKKLYLPIPQCHISTLCVGTNMFAAHIRVPFISSCVHIHARMLAIYHARLHKNVVDELFIDRWLGRQRIQWKLNCMRWEYEPITYLSRTQIIGGQSVLAVKYLVCLATRGDDGAQRGPNGNSKIKNINCCTFLLSIRFSAFRWCERRDHLFFAGKFYRSNNYNVGRGMRTGRIQNGSGIR